MSSANMHRWQTYSVSVVTFHLSVIRVQSLLNIVFRIFHAGDFMFAVEFTSDYEFLCPVFETFHVRLGFESLHVLLSL